jgi:CHAD domain-containing protein
MKDFALIGKLTNELRDLDVYLLNEDKYKAMLPSILRDDIDPLLGYLRKKRAKALQKVIRGLKTNKYFRIMNDWEAFLNTPQGDSTTASNAMLPVTDLARSRIHKKFRDAVKVGGQIRENPEDEMLHALRIHCKKLRYLMEFFSSLFTAKKLNKLIRQLKKLQDDLGYYNDLRVQREYLLSIVEELPASQQQPKKTIAAIGSLVGCLDSEKQSVKDEFQKAFTDFTSPANHELFEELFGSAAKRHVDDHTGDLQ